MKIAKKEDFALIFMGALSKYYPGKYVSLAKAAKECNLSPLFLKHIASALLQKGLLESKEGIGGGYKLSRDPGKIAISEIIGAISKGIISPICEKSGECRVKVKKRVCSCRNLWNKVNEKLFSYLENITLEEFTGI